jgi:hypothetical protein
MARCDHRGGGRRGRRSGPSGSAGAGFSVALAKDLPMNNPMDRFGRAIELGETALLRLRAEVLLDHADNGRIVLLTSDRDDLERIAVAAKPDDRKFLNGFDDQLEVLGNFL